MLMAEVEVTVQPWMREIKRLGRLDDSGKRLWLGVSSSSDREVH